MLLAAVLLACGSSDAPPAPGPTDASHVIWDRATSLDADYTVPAGTTLEIERGVVVTFAPDVSLIVQGTLLARGTAAEPIVFTGDPDAAWTGILFEDTAQDAEYTGVDVYAAGSIVEHAVVEHATRGMTLTGSSPYLFAVVFRDHELSPAFETIGGAALLISDGAAPRVRGCAFEDNLANTFAFGGAIYVHHADPILQDNVFVRNSSSYGGAISTDWMASPIVGNGFEGNGTESEGGAISLDSTVSAVVNNLVTGNTSASDGAGIHVCLTCNPHAAPYLYDNVITNNASTHTDPADGAAGVGAAFLRGFEHNDVHGNLRAGVPSDFGWYHLVEEGWPGWAATPTLPNNWWGTTDRSAIDAAVFDGADDPTFSFVALDPVASTPMAAPTPRAIIASRKMEYIDANDEIPVFLTIYNPGAPVSATLVVTRAGLPFEGTIDYPGAFAGPDGAMIEMPANSVWFATIDVQTYDGSSTDDVTWEATLRSEAGEMLGSPTVARYVLSPADAGS